MTSKCQLVSVDTVDGAIDENVEAFRNEERNNEPLAAIMRRRVCQGLSCPGEGSLALVPIALTKKLLISDLRFRSPEPPRFASAVVESMFGPGSMREHQKRLRQGCELPQAIDERRRRIGDG